MKAPIVVLHTDKPKPAHDLLATAHPDLTIRTCDTYDGLPSVLAETGAEVLYSVRFDGTPRYPRDAVLSAPHLAWVSVGGSGTDHLAPWDPAALTVTNAAGVAADMMAEYALGAALHFSLGLDAFRQAQNRRSWVVGQVKPIAGQTVLIIGLGKTGEAAAARFKAMGLKTLGVRARPRETPNVDAVYGMEDLPRLWAQADVIVVCVPLTPETRGMVGRQAFGAMKASAVLVDVSRGGVIDEAALLSALENDGLRGAALDVFAEEPLPADHRLWAFENVIVTPHCSSVYPGWDLRSVEMFSDNLSRYRRGDALQNIVNPGRGY